MQAKTPAEARTERTRTRRSTPAKAGAQMGDIADKGPRIVIEASPIGPRPSPGWRRVCGEPETRKPLIDRNITDILIREACSAG